VRVTILGAGVIAAALARAWSTVGYEVTLGVRDTSRAGVTHGITVQPLPQAIGSGQVTVLAITADAVREVCERHAAQLAGRVVIDPTITFTPGGSPVMNQLAVLQRTGARYVRAFSTQGPEVLADPVIGGQAASQFYTADDDESREQAARLIRARHARYQVSKRSWGQLAATWPRRSVPYMRCRDQVFADNRPAT
jgi:8-hydroxy-5-deazaflavin:NADPH oxidoreductase